MLLPSVAGLLAAGCATSEPFSYLDGARWNRVELNTFDTLIVSVDGKYYTQNSRVRVEPGRRKIVLQAPPVDGFRFGEQRTLELNVEPCTRYWFEAKKANALSQDWEPRVNYKEPIAGCGTAAPKSGY
jgi:hypothetical protein